LNALTRELAEQRLDDHRLYHHCRINQSLHLVSALCFIGAYGLLFVDPAAASLLAWCVAMTTRQAGHFFFEPRGYDTVNDLSDARKEAMKIGYNVRRKWLLMGVWAAIPVLLWVSPSLFGAIEPAGSPRAYLHDVGIAWLALAVGGIVIRVAQLWVERSLATGLVWVLKLLTDPFHDVVLYHRAPLALLRGERIDPMPHLRRR
jgi:hypothetical protein